MSYFLRYRLTARLELATSTSGQTLLHTCAWFGTLAPMAMLLDHGCDPSKLNDRQQSPLHLASLQGHRACVAALLKAGADPMAVDLSNQAPLHMAVIGSHYDSVRELLNNDEVDVNYPNFEGKYKVLRAGCIEHWLVFLLLIKRTQVRFKAIFPIYFLSILLCLSTPNCLESGQ